MEFRLANKSIKYVSLFGAVLFSIFFTGCEQEQEEHEHQYSVEWTFDSTGHWHKAADGCIECKQNYEPHKFVNGSCLVCNYTVPDRMITITGDGKISSFQISNTELTYKKWYEVYQWATSDERQEKKYLFQNLGREGSHGNDGAAPERDSLPVTYISWRDAVVWCNAASEKEGLEPVYYYDGKILREAENISVQINSSDVENSHNDSEKNYLGTNPENKTNAKSGEGKAEKAEVNKTKNGYRLPFIEEWNYAARANEDFIYSGSNSVDEVAWYTSLSSSQKESDIITEAQPVAHKKSNGFKLYDMSGNVCEWCWNVFDFSGTSGSSSLPKNDEVYMYVRGGGWFNSYFACALNFTDYELPYEHGNVLGFRVVRNAN